MATSHESQTGGSRIGYPQHQLLPVTPVDFHSNLQHFTAFNAMTTPYSIRSNGPTYNAFSNSDPGRNVLQYSCESPLYSTTKHALGLPLSGSSGTSSCSAPFRLLPGASAPAPPSYCTFRLIAIPATSPALGSPFMRAYTSALEALGVPREVFLQFLDHLNRVAVASPPVQVLGLAGNIAGMVPLHTAQVVGSAVNLAAKLTTVALSKGRTELLLRESNETIFEPCGLKVEVAKLDVVAKLAGIPILDSDGNISKLSTILPPMENETHDMPFSSQDRSIMALAPWLSPLDMDMLPALDMPTNAFSNKMHTHVSERQRKKEEEKLLKNRATMQKKWLHTQEVTQEYEAKMDSLTEKEQAIRAKGSRRMSKELREVGRKRESITKEFEKRASRSAKNHQKMDKEESNIRKILFLVIRQVR